MTIGLLLIVPIALGAERSEEQEVLADSLHLNDRANYDLNYSMEYMEYMQDPVNKRRKDRYKRRLYNESFRLQNIEFKREADSFLERVDERRVDREINNLKYVFVGEKIFGVTASYVTLNGDNADIALLLDGISANVSTTSIKPYMGYFYRDNRAIGARFGYSTIKGSVDSATIDLGDVNDLSFNVPYVSMRSNTYEYGIFHRSYAAIDRTGHVGLFAEVEFAASSGNCIFEYEGSDGSTSSIENRTQSVGLSINPGISVFILHNICTTLSFEFGGVSYSRIDQYNEAGEFLGSRESSQMSFVFNVLAMNFGITLHLW